MSTSALLATYSAVGGGEINVRLAGFSRIDYDKKPIRKALRLEGNQIRNVARRLVGGGPASSPGEYPAKRTGILQRAIKVKSSRSGLAVFVRPAKTARMGEDYYPAFLAQGVRAGPRVARLGAGEGIGKSNRRARGARQAAQAARGNGAWRIAPRADYMVDGLAARAVHAREAIRLALESALVPRK